MEYAIKVETLEGKVLILRRGFASQEEAEDHPIRMSHWKRVWVEAIQSSNDAVAIGKEQLDVVVEAQAGESIEVAAKGDADHVSRDLVDLLYLKLAPAWLMTNPAPCARSIIQLLSIYSGVCGHGDSFGGIVCQAFSWRDSSRRTRGGPIRGALRQHSCPGSEPRSNAGSARVLGHRIDVRPNSKEQPLRPTKPGLRVMHKFSPGQAVECHPPRGSCAPRGYMS